MVGGYFTSDGAVYEKDGIEETAGGFDSIVIAMGARSYNPLEEEVKGLVPETYVIGDADEAGQANHATEEAAAAAFRI